MNLHNDQQQGLQSKEIPLASDKLKDVDGVMVCVLQDMNVIIAMHHCVAAIHLQSEMEKSGHIVFVAKLTIIILVKDLAGSLL